MAEAADALAQCRAEVERLTEERDYLDELLDARGCSALRARVAKLEHQLEAQERQSVDVVFHDRRVAELEGALKSLLNNSLVDQVRYGLLDKARAALYGERKP